MSRIGKLPVTVPAGVTISTDDGLLTVKGPKGELSKKFPPRVAIEVTDGVAQVSRLGDEPTARAMHGLTRSLLSNMVVGVTEGFSKSLVINGVGYRV